MKVPLKRPRGGATVQKRGAAAPAREEKPAAREPAAREPGEVIGAILPLIGKATRNNPNPWTRLPPGERETARAFVQLLFETIYVNAYPDLRDAIAAGDLRSGLAHWLEYGREEIAGGGRDVGPVTMAGRTHGHSPPGSSADKNGDAGLAALLPVIDDWGRLLRACSTGEAYSPFPPASDPVQTYELIPPAARTAGRMLAEARATPANLAVHTDMREGAEHLYGCDPKIIAFYLPQFHRVKENDAWWGEGFTEWTNTRKAKPNFAGHAQPHVPYDKQYYDLTDPRVQRRQTAQAREYGITAFCYYLYWFNGRRLLERPLDQMLADHTIDHEFCVCWANENWTRTWDGKADDVLLGQTHTPESDRRFILDTIKYLRDPRYLRIGGKLALLVYRVDLLPNCRETAAIWREEVRRAGLGELHLCAVQFYGVTDPEPWGFDAAVEFPPHGWLVRENLPDTPPVMLNPNFKGHIFDYQKAIDWALSKPVPDYRWYRGVFPGWDNTARRQDTSHIFAGSDPLKFENWLTEVLRQTIITAPVAHQVVFINAWNEWSEGAHLEPDDRLGLLNLMAMNSALRTAREQTWPLGVLARLRQPGAYSGRDRDERALLSILRGQEKAFAVLTAQLRAAGVNPFV